MRPLPTTKPPELEGLSKEAFSKVAQQVDLRWADEELYTPENDHNRVSSQDFDMGLYDTLLDALGPERLLEELLMQIGESFANEILQNIAEAYSIDDSDDYEY